MTAHPAVLSHYDQLVDRTLGQNPDIILLPETALGGYVRFESNLSAWAKGTVMRTHLPLLFGSLDCSEDRSEHSNAVILITPYGTVFTYRKRRLLPFYEEIPRLGPFQARMDRLLGSSISYTPGDGPVLFDLKHGIVFGVLVCYEDVFPDLAREYAARGAQFLVAVGDTSAFGNSSESRQQLRRAQLTTIAAGLPLVRCTNSGISCVIDAYGRIRERVRGSDDTDVMVEGAEVVSVPRDGVATPYRWLGDALPLSAFSSLLVAAFLWPIAVARWGRRETDIPPFFLDTRLRA